MSQAPIGIFDSGVGGLSILKAIQQHLPNENLIYFADSKYAPYGQLEEALLKERCLYIADFFMQQNCKAMVIACNTATALMAEWLREEYEIPIIAIEPAIKPAAQMTKTQAIGVFATEHTLNSQRYQQLKSEHTNGIKVLESPCIGFVNQVEQGELDGLKTIALIESNLLPMLDQNIDTLVLGCTHYPFLINTIKMVVADHSLTIIDNADAVSFQTQRQLDSFELINSYAHSSNKFYTSGDNKKGSKIMSLLLEKTVECQSL